MRRQVRSRSRRAARAGARPGRSASRSAARSQLRARRAARHSRLLYVHRGGCSNGSSSTSMRWRRTSTGSARSSTTAASGSLTGQQRDYEPAVSAARHHDVARPVLHDRLPVRRDLSERAVSGRARTARSGDRAAREGHRGASRTSGSTTTTSRSCITGAFATSRRPRRGSAGAAEQPGAPNWLLPLAPRCSASRRTRRGARVLWTQILSADQEWLRRAPSSACVSSTPSIRSISSSASSTRRRRRRPGSATRGRAGPAGAICAAFPLDPSAHALRHSILTTGQVSVAASSDLHPMPKPSHGAGADDDRPATAGRAGSRSRPGDRQLSQRLHPSPAASASRSSAPARGARRAATRCGWR